MPERVSIDVQDLTVDLRNARLIDEQPNEQAAMLAIAKGSPSRLLSLASDIVEYGLDPLNSIAVVPSDDQSKRYFVIEGNRRLVALKALETPQIVAPALNRTQLRRLNSLSSQYQDNPIETVSCILADTEEDLTHWITLRHTGENSGTGLVSWGSEEQDRYRSRHGKRSVAGQVLERVRRYGGLSEEAEASSTRILTNLDRLISTPEVREALGIDIRDGNVSTTLPESEVMKGLTRVVEDLLTEQIKVNNIYYKPDRLAYIEGLDASDLPDRALSEDDDRTLSSGSDDVSAGSPTTPPRRRRVSRTTPRERTSLVPRDCQIDIDKPRINSMFTELLTLDATKYPNAASVLLRVFVELSTENYIKSNSLADEEQIRNMTLATKMKDSAKHLRQNGKIDLQLERAIKMSADSGRYVAAAAITMHQYVHNSEVVPRATELRGAWDELQTFLEMLWD